ncbi:MAG: hypothetical protein K6T63_00245 [Alicyclobacillus herbarius]|uniref:hypothetical protein n=1 Tax=Alicyclobacillus herbarius TaxID=122960 RepID=UPI0023537685|nr:hypothetical protein [Alicyclobacillus herbarius]MCL6631035.1 hypothetical protein [Alicyclobacillus herbarius]
MERSEVFEHTGRPMLELVMEIRGTRMEAEAECIRWRPADTSWAPGERPGRAGLARRN